MNKIRNDFTPDIKRFFIDLKNYLDTDLYFYGSVTRTDYFHGKSDIDIAIFTDNEYSIMTKMQHFLHVKKNAFDKVVWKIDKKIIYGYKIKCDKYTNIKCEISIYNNDFKKIVLNEVSYKVPLYISIILFVLKTLYYTFPIISSDTFSSYKQLIFNRIMIDKSNSDFILLKQNKV
jgi:predicted nucleotidyltransferase